MNTVRKFREDDLLHVETRDPGWESEPNAMLPVACSSEAYTFEDDHGPFAIIGCYRSWPGVANAWMIASMRMDQSKGFFVTKYTRRILADYCARQEVNRVHAVVDSRFANYGRWLELLGFEFEFTQIDAAPGNAGDLINYVYWRKGYEQAEHARDRLQANVEKLQRISR